MIYSYGMKSDSVYASDAISDNIMLEKSLEERPAAQSPQSAKKSNS